MYLAITLITIEIKKGMKFITRYIYSYLTLRRKFVSKMIFYVKIEDRYYFLKRQLNKVNIYKLIIIIYKKKNKCN